MNLQSNSVEAQYDTYEGTDVAIVDETILLKMIN